MNHARLSLRRERCTAAFQAGLLRIYGEITLANPQTEHRASSPGQRAAGLLPLDRRAQQLAQPLTDTGRTPARRAIRAFLRWNLAGALVASVLFTCPPKRSRDAQSL